jgi:hypothetical protein
VIGKLRRLAGLAALERFGSMTRTPIWTVISFWDEECRRESYGRATVVALQKKWYGGNEMNTSWIPARATTSVKPRLKSYKISFKDIMVIRNYERLWLIMHNNKKLYILEESRYVQT